MNPVCFMVMPFRKKQVTNARSGAPIEVNFDRLWDLAYRPAIEALNYLPVRADGDTGSVIVKDMLNRLRHSDLVMADLSLPNGNVYYEIGVRHVARKAGCVLLAADWSQQLFDVDQMTTLRFPLPDGAVPDDQALAIKELLVASVLPLLGSQSPYHVLVDEHASDAFVEEARAMSAFQADLGRVRYLADDAKPAAVDDLLARHREAAAVKLEVAVELVTLVRDHYPGADNANWKAVSTLIEDLPEAMRDYAVISEQYALAVSKLGDHGGAIAALEAYAGRFGWSPEIRGLVGGRLKRLQRQARDARLAAGDEQASLDEIRLLDSAIESYRQGMTLDLNEYYCASNLPGLLRERNAQGDEARADDIEKLIGLACRRAKANGSEDPWLEHTLFGSAFRGGQLDLLDDLTREVEAGIGWQLGSTLEDAENWIELAPAEARDGLQDILSRLRAAAGD